MDKYCCAEFCAAGNVARTAQMVGMDQVVCRECAEVVFIHDSMACGRLVLHFRPGGACGKARKYSHRWQIARNYPKWTNIVVRSFAPQETLLEPPRWFVWTKWYVKSVSKWFLLMFRWPAAVWCSVFDRGSLWGSSEVLSNTSKSPEIIQNIHILLCGVLRRRKLC